MREQLGKSSRHSEAAAKILVSPNRTCSTQYQPERFHANPPNGLLPIKQRANGFTVRGATVILRQSAL